MLGFLRQNTVRARAATYDEGLRSYMIKIFGNMTVALGITGLVALLTVNSSLMGLFFSRSGGMSGLAWLITFAPVLFVIFFSFKAYSIDPAVARMMLYIYSALVGLSLAPLFYMYTGQSIARVFFITASVFFAMSIYGTVTKTDLTKLGSFMIMGLVGVLIASLVNLFLSSPAIYFVISAVSVVVFTGLTAYDVQRLMQVYYSVPTSLRENAAVIGALNLYLDFINLFVSLLRLFGDRK